MPIIQIGTKLYAGGLKERLFFELDLLEEDKIHIDIKEYTKGDLFIFECDCYLQEDFTQNISMIFKEYIANVLSDLIINKIEEELLEQILKNNYKQFSALEQEEILDLAIDRLNFLISEEDQSIVSKIQRKNRILLKILDYLDTESEITLEGFVRFRLKEYLTELKSAIDIAVDDFIVEKEYEEFIHLLKYFVDTQETKNQLVNVVKIKNGHFKLLDESGEVLENTYLDEYIFNIVDCQLDYEDLLISALITTAPEEIILHFKEPVSLLKTLENVFGDKISICLGCDYCKLNNLNEGE